MGGIGFEPTALSNALVFKTSTLNHSATCPWNICTTAVLENAIPSVDSCSLPAPALVVEKAGAVPQEGRPGSTKSGTAPALVVKRTTTSRAAVPRFGFSGLALVLHPLARRREYLSRVYFGPAPGLLVLRTRRPGAGKGGRTKGSHPPTPKTQRRGSLEVEETLFPRSRSMSKGLDKVRERRGIKKIVKVRSQVKNKVFYFFRW